jgi:hypothetical protein
MKPGLEITSGNNCLWTREILTIGESQGLYSELQKRNGLIRGSSELTLLYKAVYKTKQQKAFFRPCAIEGG